MLGDLSDSLTERLNYVPHRDRLLDRIAERCISYLHQPELGERRPELGAAIRCYSVGVYVVYYRPPSMGIELIRVLHGARDVNWNF